ncbi:GIY-YIG nuclease family protein [Luteimonas sp. A482]
MTGFAVERTLLPAVEMTSGAAVEMANRRGKAKSCHFDRREKSPQQPAIVRIDARFKEEPVPKEHRYFVYILTNRSRKVMYIGMTNDLGRRLHEHRTHAVAGFTAKYRVETLVSFEETFDVLAALEREKQLKKWRREKKNALVASMNPQWRDLGVDFSLRSK